MDNKYATRDQLPPFGAGKAYPAPLHAPEDYIVDFESDTDPLRSQNWPLKRKLLVAAILGYTTYTTGWSSSIFSPAVSIVSSQYGVSSEVGTLGVSLFIFGFATGPVLWAPASELYGRRAPIIISMLGYTIFEFAVATGKDIQTVLICRFWCGFFGACPVSVVPAVFADLFSNTTRGLAMTAYSLSVSTSPLLSPVVGGFVVANKSLGWRWTQYITGIMAATALLLNIFLLRETYSPRILKIKVVSIRIPHHNRILKLRSSAEMAQFVGSRFNPKLSAKVTALARFMAFSRTDKIGRALRRSKQAIT
ncbi:bicyclomycin resistance protein, putative [Talaromyces stipitatus ATCC 10500]|uniref:Bicyclomycin resistance protein, putative n=1 Tax=Talaromyces stipitatus (strain ATCC 10500 / CBS 375.48 / QM 6759 / NRRL 1006) TaxID=441959 RepID=B8MKY3_TALSN|nr:bicyclomycin resistance protein, putative [Talaromyces stipitatus ATCC 10500]EED15399.1 bicyclomycin resistance protein, putative [Talaromyces stipitatus ATCC 10500]